eukprot:4940737-Pleurochrysis_carterae.AAC.2
MSSFAKRSLYSRLVTILSYGRCVASSARATAQLARVQGDARAQAAGKAAALHCCRQMRGAASMLVRRLQTVPFSRVLVSRVLVTHNLTAESEVAFRLLAPSSSAGAQVCAALLRLACCP